MRKLLKISALSLSLGCFYCIGEPETKEEEPIYLDYAASSPINEEALKVFNEVSRLDGNSSGFNQHARRLDQIENEAVASISSKMGCSPQQLLFTNSATVSNNIAILGVARKYPKCHLITTKIEHKSVLNVFKQLEQEGHRVTYLNVDRYGHIDLEELKSSITPETRLVSIQTFNSEIGVRQDMQTISEIVHRHPGVLLHSDASQSFRKYPIDLSLFDFVTISGYKIGAPKGIAALFIKNHDQLAPILFGSRDSLFPGSRPTALIAAFAKAVETYQFDAKAVEHNFSVLKSEVEKIDDVYINSDTPSHVFSVSIGGVQLGDLVNRMRKYSFSAGCSCIGRKESNVRESIDPEGKLPSCTLRVSFDGTVSEKKLIEFAQQLKTEVEYLRKQSPVGKGCDKISDQKELNIILKSLDDSKD